VAFSDNAKCKAAGGFAMLDQAMTDNRINPAKLLHSKWTAAEPRNREKHFLVTKLLRNDDGIIIACRIEAVHSQREFELDWRALKDTRQWLIGWQ
jgi:tryptophan-rich hypothetical protein